MPSAGFEPANPRMKRLQTYAFDYTTTGQILLTGKYNSHVTYSGVIFVQIVISSQPKQMALKCVRRTNCRGVSLLSTAYKILSNILLSV